MLDEKTVTITPTEGDYYSTYDLSSIDDFYEISRVTYTDEYGYYYGSIDFQRESDTLILFHTDGEYHLVYYAEPPIIQDVTNTPDSTEVTFRNELLRIIPYYIKGELYEEDQPELAAQAMALFEQKLARTRRRTTNIQREIDDVYKMTD
jgi:hypothetical protein